MCASFWFEANIYSLFWTVTCLSDYFSFSCKDAALWQEELLTGDYVVPLPCVARHEELITVLMLQGSDRLWLTGSCAGAAHLKERQERLAPLAPFPLLGSTDLCFLNGKWDGSLPIPSLPYSNIDHLVNSKLNLSHQCGLEAKRSSCTLGCIKHGIARWSREVIIWLCSALTSALPWALCAVLGTTI